MNKSGEVLLKRRSSELKEYKVLGTSGSVIIALNPVDHQPVAIKVKFTIKIIIYYSLNNNNNKSSWASPSHGVDLHPNLYPIVDHPRFPSGICSHWLPRATP